MFSPLAIRTEKRRPPADHDPADRPPATPTGFSGPAINSMAGLKIAQVAPNAAIITDGRSPGPDGIFQDPAKDGPQPGRLRSAQAGRRRPRMNPGSMEGFVGVDISHSGQHPLIEEHAFHPPPAGGQPGREILPGDFQGFGAEAGDLPAGRDLAGRKTPHEAEFSDVPKTQFLGRIRKRKDEMGVFVARSVRPKPKKLAGHFQMKQEGPGFRFDDQNLAPPAHGRDPSPAERPKLLRRRRPQKLGQRTCGLGNLPADDSRPQTGGDGFDFGKFGHAGILSVFGPGFTVFSPASIHPEKLRPQKLKFDSDGRGLLRCCPP
jgi:hypothetical protein